MKPPDLENSTLTLSEKNAKRRENLVFCLNLVNCFVTLKSARELYLRSQLLPTGRQKIAQGVDRFSLLAVLGNIHPLIV